MARRQQSGGGADERGQRGVVVRLGAAGGVASIQAGAAVYLIQALARKA